MLDNKNLRVPIRALSQIQLGGGVENQTQSVWNSGKKFKSSRESLAKLSGGEGGGGTIRFRVFKILEKKNSRAPADT